MAELFTREAGTGEPVALLHGLFGNGGNLGALSRALREQFRVLRIDLPGHGRSPAPSTFDLSGMADLLVDWMDEIGIAQAHFVGHSLGGKVAMELALGNPARVTSLTVVDIAPVAYGASHHAVFAGLDAVAHAQCGSREEASATLSEHIEEAGIVQFLLSDLRRDEQGVLQWRFDLEALHRAYPVLSQAPAGGRTYAGPVLFVKGGRSNYLKEIHRAATSALFPAAQVKVIPGAGHWLHVEKPDVFNSIVHRFLSPAPG